MNISFESLIGKNVLITGGSGAIGFAIANAFMDVGANVILWGHREIESEKEKIFCLYQIVELEDKIEIEKNFKVVTEKTEHIDILVNCAGYTKGCASEHYKYEEWMKTLSINLTAPFILSQLVAQNMIQNNIEGSIINITSIGAELGFPENPAYQASKGGLRQLSKGLAYDWADKGIRVNCVGPGYTKTKMTKKSWENLEARDDRSRRTMLNRWAEPEDLIGMVLLLASDLGRYITGQDFYIDGGWTAKGL